MKGTCFQHAKRFKLYPVDSRSSKVNDMIRVEMNYSGFGGKDLLGWDARRRKR